MDLPIARSGSSCYWSRPGSRCCEFYTARRRNCLNCRHRAICSIFVLQIRDTAHTKGVGIGIVIAIESAILQVTVVIVTATLNRA